MGAFKTIITVFFVLMISPFVFAGWNLELTGSLEGAHDIFIVGTEEGALDGYDMANDLLQPPMPQGKTLRVQSVLDGQALKADIKSELSVGEEKSWDFMVVAIGGQFTGENKLKWGSLPENIDFKIIDYGVDGSRSSAVTDMGMNDDEEFSFDVDNQAGVLRYMTLVATKTEECSPDWQCNDWSGCSNGKRVRICADVNACGIMEDKPVEEEACNVVNPQPQQPSGSSGGGGGGIIPTTVKQPTEQKPEIVDDQEEIVQAVDEKITDEKNETAQQPNENPIVSSIFQRLMGNPLTAITGRAVERVSETNPIAGISILLAIVVAGLAVYLYFRNEK